MSRPSRPSTPLMDIWNLPPDDMNSDLDTFPTLGASRRLAEARWPTAPAPTGHNKRPHSPGIEPNAKKARIEQQASRPETKAPNEQEPFRRDVEKAWKRQDKEAEKQEQYRQEMRAHAKKEAEKAEQFRQEMKAHAKKEAEKAEQHRRAAEKAWKRHEARTIEEAKKQEARWDATAYVRHRGVVCVSASVVV